MGLEAAEDHLGDFQEASPVAGCQEASPVLEAVEEAVPGRQAGEAVRYSAVEEAVADRPPGGPTRPRWPRPAGRSPVHRSSLGDQHQC